jgi:hypothetical protein
MTRCCITKKGADQHPFSFSEIVLFTKADVVIDEQFFAFGNGLGGYQHPSTFEA